MHSAVLSSAFALSLLSARSTALALPWAKANPSPEAYDNGQWTPAANTWQAASTWVATTTATTVATPVAQVSSAKTTITTAATATATASGTAAAPEWQMTAIWPNGCDTWANPCPAGAHMSNGQIAGSGVKTTSVAGYENGFTSYTTMTDANGVITGMPAVATVAAGVSTTANATTKSTSTKTTLSTITSSTGTQTSFQTGSATTAKAATASTGAASANHIARAAVLFGAAGFAALL